MADCEPNLDSPALDLCVEFRELRFADSETIFTHCENGNSLAAVRAGDYESPHIHSRHRMPLLYQVLVMNRLS